MLYNLQFFKSLLVYKKTVKQVSFNQGMCVLKWSWTFFLVTLNESICLQMILILSVENCYIDICVKNVHREGLFAQTQT